MDISFIIPCHNLESYIKPLLLSLQALDLTDITYEFIFILDDCIDNTEAIITHYMNNYFYKIIKCNYHSCGLARNEGLNIAQGDFIWFLDGDDWVIYPLVVKDCLTILKEKNENIIQIPFISNFFKIQYFSMVWQYIYRRSFIGDLRFKEIQPNEDVEFNRKLLTELPNGEITVYNIPSYFYNYNRPGSNMSQYRQNGKINP